jgi:hypothetical protein
MQKNILSLGLGLFSIAVALPVSMAHASQGTKSEAEGKAQVKVEAITAVGVGPAPKTALVQDGVSLREVPVGGEIRPGEHVRTDEKTRVLIAYPDGSRLTVLPGTDVAIEGMKDGVETNTLRAGRVQGEVKKSVAALSMNAEGTKKPVKFVIRTKAATMGVRGTQFVVGADAVSGLSQFHTLEGAVEVAQSPGALLGGQGVSVTGGSFVTATESGLSAVAPFTPADLLKTLDTPFGQGSGALSGAADKSASAAATAAANAAAAVAPSIAPPAPAPKLPDSVKKPEPPASVTAQKQADAEKEKPEMHLLAISVGGFISEEPQRGPHGEHQVYRALSIAWTPIIPVPIPVLAPYVRGSFGVHGAQDGSLYNKFLVKEFAAYAGTNLLNPLFAEIGGGEQIWNRPRLDAGVIAANAGLILSQNGKWNRIYVGVARFFGGDDNPMQGRVGLTLQF